MLRHFAPTKTTGCHTFKKRLIVSSFLVRGHSASDLLPTFNLAIEKIFVKRTRREIIIAHLRARNKKIPLFSHLPFNPHDPPGRTIQAAFMDTIIHPPSSNHISLLDTIKLHGGAVDFDEHFTVCTTYPCRRGYSNFPYKF